MKTKKSCFTLIELLVVVLIIGILAAIALPQYQRAVLRSRAVEAVMFHKSLYDAEQLYFLANGVYTLDLSKLDITYNGTVPVVCSDDRCEFTGPHFSTTLRVHPVHNTLSFETSFPNGLYLRLVSGGFLGNRTHCYHDANETNVKLCIDAGFTKIGNSGSNVYP
jgi:prepilin-type N-terminal cleavage/methylation domain-containing protein